MQQGSDNYRLVVRRGPQPNQSYELTKDVNTLGRDITNDIVINDREVSRHHLRISRTESGFTIEDLGSTNGTFVNGKRLGGITPLNNGDIIGLGETVTLVFERVRGAMPSPGPAVPGERTQEGPSGPAESPYQPPEQQPPAQQPPPAYEQPQGAPQPSPYQQPAQQPSPYEPPQQPPPEQLYYGQQQPGYSPPPGPPGAAGYDYDPYAMREEEGGGAMRWILFGCIGLLLLCCCISVIALFVIDATNQWCSIPLLRDILEAIGLLACPV